MLALIGSTDVQPGFLRDFIGGGVTVRHADVLGAPCVNITIAASQGVNLDRRLKAAARAIRRTGAEVVCFAEDFPYAEQIKAFGFLEADAAELYDAVSDKAAEYLVSEGSAAYLYAPRPHVMALRTLAVLCRRCKLVMADMPGGEDAFTALRRSVGVSIVENAPAHMLAEAETAIIFGAPRFTVALPSTCVVYASDPDALRTVNAARYVSELDTVLPEVRERLLPSGFPRSPLIAEALRRLTLSRDAVALRDLTITAVRELIF